MRRSATQRRADHWAAFIASMAARHSIIGRAEPTESEGTVSAQHGPPPRDIIDGFADHLIRHAPRQMTAPAWWRPRAYRHWSGRCAYCDRALSSTGIVCLDHLIPPSVGGPHHADAVVLCCVSCRRAKAGRDLLMGRREPNADLHAMRLRLAPDSYNHVGPTDEDVRRRWRRPRFACHVLVVEGGTLIGWRRLSDAPIGAYICLGIDHGATACSSSRFDGTGPVVYWASDANGNLTVLRDLIEQNAWVRPILPAHHTTAIGNLPAWLFAAPGGIRALPGMKRGPRARIEW